VGTSAQIRSTFLAVGFVACSVTAHQPPPQPSPRSLRSDQQDEISKLQRKYNDERNPVHKAKLLVRLGELQVADAASRSSINDYSAALEKLQQYRSEIEVTHSAFLGTIANPALKPDGLHQLQISLRENLRRIQDIVLAMPASQRSIFATVQQDLEGQNQKMLDELFPNLEKVPAKPQGHG
jgi:hypothetical protein